MVDKTINDLTEITSLSLDDYLIVETSSGTRKIKRSNISVQGRKAPTMLQKGTLRNDGTIALPVAPTVGNLMVHVQGGFNTYPAYTPAGFANVAIFSSNANNFVVASVRRVVSGDTGSYSVSASDNQFCALYEYQDAEGIYGVVGGAAPVSGSTINYPCPPSPFGPNDECIIVIEHDATAVATITPETGLIVDYQPLADGSNHIGAIYRRLPSFDGSLNGSWSGTPTAPVWGVFAVAGRWE